MLVNAVRDLYLDVAIISENPMTTHTWADLEALSPEWEAVFGESIPMGFEIQPEQVPMMRQCIREKSREPLRNYIESIGDRTY